MTTSTITASQMTWVWSQEPNRNYSTWNQARLSEASGTGHAFLVMSPGNIAGRVVLSAFLEMTTLDAWPAGEVQVQAVGDTTWAPSKVTWDNRPGLTGTNHRGIHGAITKGGVVRVDVTALVQSYADGFSQNGWRVRHIASAQRRVDRRKTRLVIEVSDAPAIPTELTPGGGVIGRAKWVTSFDYNDFLGNADLTTVQIQIDPDGEEDTPPVYDTGEVATSIPWLDLARTDLPGGVYAGLADGATTYWRVRTRSSQGIQTDWSDYVEVTRDSRGTFAVTSPTGGTVGDPTPLVTATMTGGLVASYRVAIVDDSHPADVRYDSGVVSITPKATIQHQIPFLNKEGKVVLSRSDKYRLTVRAWDRDDRQFDGDQPWYESVTTFSVVGAGAGPTKVTAAQLPHNAPGMTLRVERATAPSKFVLLRDGERVASFTVGTDIPATGPWDLFDPGAPPNREATWEVRAVTGSVESTTSNLTVTARSRVDGVWLLSGTHGRAVIAGESSGFRYVDRRVSVDLPFSRHSVDVVGALRILEGPFEGALLEDPTATIAARITTLRAIGSDPATPVRLVTGTLSEWVRIRDMSITPDPQMLPDYDQMWHAVSFSVYSAEAPEAA